MEIFDKETLQIIAQQGATVTVLGLVLYFVSKYFVAKEKALLKTIDEKDTKILGMFTSLQERDLSTLESNKNLSLILEKLTSVIQNQKGVVYNASNELRKEIKEDLQANKQDLKETFAVHIGQFAENIKQGNETIVREINVLSTDLINRIKEENAHITSMLAKLNRDEKNT